MFVTAILRTALQSKNSTNPLKIEIKTNRCLYIHFLDIYVLKAVHHKFDQVKGILWNLKAMYFRTDYQQQLTRVTNCEVL